MEMIFFFFLRNKHTHTHTQGRGKEIEMICYLSVYSYHVILTFCHKVRKIEGKNCKVSDYSSI